MKLRINGRDYELPGAMRLSEFLQQKGIDPRLIVVEYNYEIVPRERYDQIILGEGDNLEIVHMIAGG